MSSTGRRQFYGSAVQQKQQGSTVLQLIVQPVGWSVTLQQGGSKHCSSAGEGLEPKVACRRLQQQQQQHQHQQHQQRTSRPGAVGSEQRMASKAAVVAVLGKLCTIIWHGSTLELVLACAAGWMTVGSTTACAAAMQWALVACCCCARSSTVVLQRTTAVTRNSTAYSSSLSKYCSGLDLSAIHQRTAAA